MTIWIPVTIEGNIASGKTSAIKGEVKRLESRGVKVITMFEDSDQCPFLEGQYGKELPVEMDSFSTIFCTQMWFAEHRLEGYEKIAKLRHEQDGADRIVVVLFDRCIFGDMAFAKNLLNLGLFHPQQFDLYAKQFERNTRHLPPLSLAFYLDTPVEECMRRKLKRARDNGEVEWITPEYLKGIELETKKVLDDMVSKKQTPILVKIDGMQSPHNVVEEIDMHIMRQISLFISRAPPKSFPAHGSMC
jgi:thymidylate kinase